MFQALARHKTQQPVLAEETPATEASVVDPVLAEIVPVEAPAVEAVVVEPVQHQTTEDAVPAPKVTMVKAVVSARMGRLIGNRVVAILSAADAVRTSSNAYKTMRHTKHVIAKHGASRPLMAVISRGDTLARISSMPATESLNVVPLGINDKRNMALLSEMSAALEAEQTVVSDWIGNAADDVGDFIDATAYHLAGLRDEMADIQSAMSAVNSNDATMASISAFNVPAASRMAQMDTVSGILSNIGPIDVNLLCCDNDYRDNTKQSLRDCCDSLSDFAGITRDGDSMMRTDDITDQNCDRQGNMLELGYSCESMSSLVENGMNLINSLQNVVDQKDEIVASMMTARDATPAPAAEDVMSTEDMVSADGSYTLDDHRQMISGYLHVLAATVDCAVTNAIGVMAAGRAMIDADPVMVTDDAATEDMTPPADEPEEVPPENDPPQDIPKQDPDMTEKPVESPTA